MSQDVSHHLPAGTGGDLCSGVCQESDFILSTSTFVLISSCETHYV